MLSFECRAWPVGCYYRKGNGHFECKSRNLVSKIEFYFFTFFLFFPPLLSLDFFLSEKEKDSILIKFNHNWKTRIRS